MSSFRGAVLDTANDINEETGYTDLMWDHGHQITTSTSQPGVRPDIGLKSRRAGISSQGRGLPFVAGEMKLPCYSLGSGFTAEEFTCRIQHRDYLQDAQLNPFFQALSYAIATQNGVSFLSIFDQNRYFRVNIRLREIWMSDLVKVDQRLDPASKKPHALQALLYTTGVKADEKEFSTSLLEGLAAKGLQGLEREEKRKAEEEKKKRSSSNRGNGAGGSKDHARSGKSKKRSASVFPPVSRVLRECKMIGVLGEGVTEEVRECDYKGDRVAVKVGLKDFSLDLDCMEHVRNEIRVYRVLEDLQGSVIPRVIEEGLDTVHNARHVLITEKVGMVVEVTEREIIVGGKALDRESLILFKRKGLEGLRKMRGRGVVHGDYCTRNMRVEMNDGKVERVCWIDFWYADVVDDEGRTKEWIESEDDDEDEIADEVEAKSEDEDQNECVEYLEYPEEMIETHLTECFASFVDRFISYAEE